MGGMAFVKKKAGVSHTSPETNKAESSQDTSFKDWSKEDNTQMH